MNSIVNHYIIDLSSNNNFVQIPTMQGDGNGVRTIEIELIQNGKPYEVDTSEIAGAIMGTKPDTKEICNPLSFSDEGYLLVDITSQMSAVPGRGEYQIMLYHKNKNVQLKSFPFFIITTPSSFDIDYVESSDEFRLLVDLFNKAEADYTYVMEHAQASADAADESKNAAKESETNAKESERNAKAYEEAASSSAEQAKESESSAALSEAASAASAAASKASEDSALASAVLAQESETAAKASETAAAISEANAGIFADTASEKAAEAANSAQAAKVSETNAAGSTQAAAASAQAAADSAAAALEEAEKASASAETASLKAEDADHFAVQAESFAHGGTDSRDGEDSDNAKYYSERSKEYSNAWKGSLLPQGAVLFDALPKTGNIAGHLYHITDAFITDNRFKDGAGYSYPAGTNVYWTADGKWDCLSGNLTRVLTQAEYDALPEAEKLNGTTYYIYDADNTLRPATDTEAGLMSPEDKSKLDGIAEGAEANVQADWNVTDASSAAYIKNKPAALPANGGNADTVNSHTVHTDVPADAAFTDTVYTHPISGITAGTYKSVTVDKYGHITAGTNPSTLSEFGITDGATSAALSTAVSAHDTSASAHADIRASLSDLITRLNALADSDDTTLDQLSEIVSYIKANRNLIESVTTSKVNISDIVDDLISTAVDKPLSANQGKVLHDLIRTLTDTVNTKIDTVLGDSFIDTTRSGTAVTISHRDISRENTASGSQPFFGNTFTAVKSVTSDAKGHVTGIDTATITIPDTVPNFTEAAGLSKLTSGEKLSAAFGKISRAISDFISHAEDTVKHISSSERTNWDLAYTHAQSAHAPANAEANQNAFSNVAIGSSTIAADSKTDTLTLVAGNNVTLTPDTANDKITIAAADTVYTHPSYAAKSNGLYKVTVDNTGHVSAAAAVTKADITALGIPANDTTYSALKNPYAFNINGISYDGSSEKAIDLLPFIVGTQTETTGAWTGNASSVAALFDGLTIRYWLPYAGSGNATLNLTLSDGTATGAINCYYSGATRLTTHYAAGNVLTLTYRSNVSIAGSTATYTGWWADANCNNDTYDRLRYNGPVKCGTAAISASTIIVGMDGVYHPLKAGTAFDITYPVLYASSAISANTTGTKNYLAINFTVTATQSISLTSYKPVYIKGNLSGTVFTPISTAPFTQVLPDSADGYVYMLLGIATSTSACYLLPEHPIYAYTDTFLSRIGGREITGLSVSGQTITYTRADGTSDTITTQDSNTDSKVTNTLAATTKAYITGTTSAATNTGTQVFDTGVYLDTTAGTLTAVTFRGDLAGNAATATSSASCTGNSATATALTTSAGSETAPVYFSDGKPVACTGIAYLKSLTEAEYNALSNAEKMNGTIYFITDTD